jgi:SAM-dependent methyltransferase
VEGKAVKPRFAPAPHAHELLEGFVLCDKCRTEYPVIAGVLILAEDIKTYVSSHYSLLLTCAAAEGALGPEMLRYLRSSGYDFIQLNTCDHFYGRQSLYISAHYHDLGPTTALRGGPFAGYLQNEYEDFYDLLFSQVKGHLSQNQIALDVGCNVGGMTYRLSRHCASVFGVDLSFASTLTARKLLLHQPAAQWSYCLPKEGRRFEERCLSLERRENVEMLVASGMQLPFPAGMFDLVSCLSVIDCVPDPVALIRSLASSLKPGGILLISDPYSWSVDATHVKEWLGEETGQPSAAAMQELLAEEFDILWEQDGVPWILREHGSFYQVWLNHCLLAQKKWAR